MLFRKWWFQRTILKYGSPLISPLEKKGIKKYGGRKADHPSLFIIGPPRSGSTIFYQLVSSLLDIGYVDNLANLSRQNPFFGMELSQLRFKGKSHQSYSSNYGRTSEDGLHAPAEALFFYKWFPRDRHYTEPSDLSPKQSSELCETMNGMINRIDKPLVIKNLSFSLRLQVLREFMPDSRYLLVRRDPLYTIQSVLMGMRKNNQPENKVWGILPRDFKELEGLDPIEMVVRQVNSIERQIYSDLKKIPDDKVLIVDYEKLGDNLDLILDEVIRLCKPSLVKKTTGTLPEIKTQNRIMLPDDEIEAIKAYIKSMNWELHNN